MATPCRIRVLFVLLAAAVAGAASHPAHEVSAPLCLVVLVFLPLRGWNLVVRASSSARPREEGTARGS